MDKPPLQKVVGSRLLVRSVIGGGTYVEDLECGHTKIVKASQLGAKRRRCDKCATVRSSTRS